MRIRASVSAAALSVLLLAGCATSTPTPADTPDAATSAEPSPSPTSPSPTPTAPQEVVDPVRLFDGDCGEVLTDAQLQDVVGAGAMTDQDYLVSVGTPVRPRVTPEGTLGGLECRWRTAEESSAELGDATVLILPAPQVPASFVGAFADRECAPMYDAMICRVARTADDVWIMARSGHVAGESGEEPSEESLRRVIDAVAESLPRGAGTPEPVTRTAAWWNTPSCEEFATAMRFDELTDGGFEHGYWEGSEQAEQTLFDAAGVSRHCPFYTSSDRMTDTEEHRIFSVLTYPGGQWMWETLAEGAEALDLEGAEAAMAYLNGNAAGTVYATDGVNVVEVGGDEDLDFFTDVAERALAVLASS